MRFIKTFLLLKRKMPMCDNFFKVYLIFEFTEKHDERRQDVPDFSDSNSD